MQISVFAGVSAGESAIDATVEHLAQLQADGFRRVWLPQLPHEPDVLTVLAVVLREVDGLQVGTGVIPIQNQHPMLLAQRALTLSLIGQGRFRLGLGMTHQAVTEGMWGIPWDRPVRRLREYLDGLQPLLAGQHVEAVGQTVTTRGAVQVPGAAAPELFVAALGPQLLRLAGARTDGTITWMTGPTTLADHIGPTLRAAAADVGRPAGAVRVVACLPVSVTDDVDAARARAAEQFAVYGHLPSYRAMLEREGYTGPADVAIIGDEASVADRIRDLAAGGVDEFVGVVFDGDPEGRARTRAVLRRLDG